MKSLNSAITLLIAATLVTGVTGCKHAVKGPTPIPAMMRTPVGDGSNPNGPVTGTNPNKGPGNGNVGPGSTLPNTGDGNSNPLTGNNGVNGKDLPNTGANGPGLGDGTLKDRPNMENTDQDRTTLQAETVYFDYDKSAVKSSEVPRVQRVAAYLKSNPTAQLLVEGNCDERGTEEYNRSLGERRALAVRELLVTSGVAPERVTTVSFGEDKPSDPGHDEAAWTKNRRAEFVVLRPKSLQ